MSKESAKTIHIGHIVFPVAEEPRLAKIKAFLQFSGKHNISRKRDVIAACTMKGMEAFEAEMERYKQQ